MKMNTKLYLDCMTGEEYEWEDINNNNMQYYMCVFLGGHALM